MPQVVFDMKHLSRTTSATLPWALPLALLIAPLAHADEIYLCSHDALTRAVLVEYQRPGRPLPCRVQYSKPTEHVVEYPWRARNEAGYCEARVLELVARLESFGWNCRQSDLISEVREGPWPAPPGSP